MGNLLNNKFYNYLLGLVVSFIVFIILTISLNKAGFTTPIWGIGAITCSIMLTLGSVKQIKVRETSQLLFFGTQTGIWLNEGYYILFYLFTLDKHETQHTENQTLIVPAFDIRCNDKMLSVSFNLKYLEGKSNVPNPTEDDERLARENFKNQKADELREELIDLMKNLAMQEFGNKDYSRLHGQNLASMITNNTHFMQECIDYGIKMKSFLPYVIPKNATQEDSTLRKAQLITQYKDMGYTLAEAREMAEIELGQIKVVRGGAGTLGRFDV